MLAITAAAWDALEGLAAASTKAGTTGVRISATTGPGGSSELLLVPVLEPEAGDVSRQADSGHVRAYIDAETAERFAEQVLDVGYEQGQASFVVSDG